MPEVVAEIARNLMTVGVKPTNMVIHERGGGQILLRMADDGVSMGPGRAEGAGLAYMRAQVLSLSGTLKLMRGPCGRMVIEASVPIPDVPK